MLVNVTCILLCEPVYGQYSQSHHPTCSAASLKVVGGSVVVVLVVTVLVRVYVVVVVEVTVDVVVVVWVDVDELVVVTVVVVPVVEVMVGRPRKTSAWFWASKMPGDATW